MKACCLAILLLIFGGHVKGQEKPVTQQQKKVINLIAALPEVVAMNKQMLKYNGSKLIIEIDREPSKDRNYYCISVYEDMGGHAAALYRFNVDSKTYVISYWDVATDKVMNLDYWRKNKKRLNLP